MQSEMFPIEVRFSIEFQKSLARLSKRYRHIQSDIEPLIKEIQNRGLPGDRVPGVRYEVYKVRVNNSDLKKGKRSGYRVVYYLQEHDKVLFVAIYSKSEQPDIRPHQIERMINEYQANLNQN